MCGPAVLLQCCHVDPVLQGSPSLLLLSQGHGHHHCLQLHLLCKMRRVFNPAFTHSCGNTDTPASVPFFHLVCLGHPGEVRVWGDAQFSVVDGHVSDSVWTAGASCFNTSESHTGGRTEGQVKSQLKTSSGVAEDVKVGHVRVPQSVACDTKQEDFCRSRFSG